MTLRLKPFASILVASMLLFSSMALAQDTHPRHDPAVQHVEPFQVFDNLYYVGADWVAAWLLRTNDGLILIDSLYGELTDLAIDGIKELGMDPADIRYVLVTHGHFDHVGGAKRFQDEYGATVAMLEEDWQMVAGEPVYRPYPRPQKQFVMEDGDALTLGDTTVTFYKTPGHTLGTMSMQFTVFDDGKPHQAFMLGGAGLNFSGVERTQIYIDSIERIKAMDGIAVNIPNHAGSGEVFERRDALAARKTGEAHSFVDPAAFQLWLDQLLVNARAKLVEEREAAGS